MFKLNTRLSLVAAALMISSTVNATAEDEIEKITVVGQYLSSSKANSIKSPTPIIDVPQSLTIIGDQEITDRGFTSLGQLVDYIPGINTSQGEGHRDSFVFRGIRSTADFYLDGNRDDVQYYRSLYNIEQVEILRGPNALLFGRGGTGGVLNRVAKKADFGSEFTQYQVSIDSYGEANGQVDYNTQVSENTAFRVNAMYETLSNHRDFYDGTRVGVNPTARFNLSEDSVLDVSYEYVSHERFIDRGIPTDANGLPVESLSDIVFGDPDNNFHEVDAHIVRANLEHSFNANLKGNVNVFYGDYDKVYSNFYASNYDQDLNEVQLDGYIDTTQRQNFIVSSNLVSEFSALGAEHTLIAGTELILTDSNQDRYNPVFSSTGSDREWFSVERPLNFRGLSGVNAEGESISTDFTSLNDDTHVELQVYSFYIQDEIALSESFDLILGARFDSFDIEVFNANPSSLETRTRVDEAVSPRAGLVYKPQESLSFYLSYTESFLPKSGEQFTDINGDDDKLSPDTFSNQEIGLKWDINSTLSFTAALFQNEQESPVVSDADSSTLDIQKSSVDGFEMQLFGELSESISLNANYSHLSGETANGTVPRELPEDTFSAWIAHQVSDVFGYGIGATYQDDSFIDNGNTRVMPSYTRVDAAIYYQVSDEMRVQLNLENLTDELYFPNAHSSHQVTVGAPFNAMLTLSGSL